jgi:zona occludens toxin
MLIFHEGLPGSGKSYEATINRIIPALKKGRQVFAYIEGINFEMFAEITEIPLDKLKGKIIENELSISDQKNYKYTRLSNNKIYAIQYEGLLFQIENEQVNQIDQYVADDSLVIIDELQDFFPVGMRKLSDGITKFVTQHRHRGLDVVVMGQDHRDCHNLWKRRIDQLIHFVKRDAIGRPNDYTWKTFKQNQGKFTPLRSGKGTYDAKYFGLYASFVQGAENTESYQDDRSNVFKSKAFTFYLPVFAAVFIFAVYYLFGFFTGDNGFVKNAKANTVQQENKVVYSGSAKSLATMPQPASFEGAKNDPDNYVLALTNDYRIRLAGLVENKKKLIAYVEFLDNSFHIHEKLSLIQLKALGWDYMRTQYGLKLVKDGTTLVVTAWPLDSIGKVSNVTRSQI